MDENRRYSGEEVDRIFSRALEPGSGREPEGGEGLTLAEIREIGREVGIPAGRIEAAAAALDLRPAVARTFGLPLAVSHEAHLPRALTEREWEGLVSDLRATFGAAGRVHRDGTLRGWTNGNLHVFVEPEGTGYRLRMGTTKGNAKSLFAVGGGTLAMSALLGTLSLVGADVPLAGAGSLLAMSIGTFVAGAAGLPRWARTRLHQMQALAQRTVSRVRQDDAQVPRESPGGSEPDAALPASAHEEHRDEHAAQHGDHDHPQ